ncbi:molybdopterin-dependent oxidoreductase [Aquibium oceanicum]|uniref:Oxidoreductase molybdopterin-binding domain-containing protein n=1 Tax=Aquibium oceanicum TaxID=1670800 RepID=A0A1L3SW10_9HYPH|nr:molybdopterin-dependent oxidoreductase [Aquibium oceanicum]APH73512.1 hypothetical protein BSQ44_20660 [Aquibium oceanicum]
MRALLISCALAMLGATSTLAAELGQPKGTVILSVTGAIERTNSGEAAEFDLAMLEEIAGRSASMRTPWTDSVTEFEGPYLDALLEAVGAHGHKLVVKALNDYSAELPLEDARDFETILALRMNGETMSVREKGPLFLIYPFDKNPELYNEKYFSRSVWQIREIEVVD